MNLSKIVVKNEIMATLSDGTIVHIGDMIKDDYDWHIVTYISVGKEMFRCTGLGKSGEYSIHISDIKGHKVVTSSVLQRLHNNQAIVWTNKEGNKIFVSYPLFHKSEDIVFEFSDKVFGFFEIARPLFSSDLIFSNYKEVGFIYQFNGLIKLGFVDDPTNIKNITKEFSVIVEKFDNRYLKEVLFETLEKEGDENGITFDDLSYFEYEK